MARAAPMLCMLLRVLLIPIGLLLLLIADAAGILPQSERPAEAA